MERRRLRYEGRVQGVGFRATARALAADFRVTGWVRNEPDESVLLEVQGEPTEIDPYLEAMRRHMGRLIRLETVDGIPAIPTESGFTIRH